MHHQKQYFLRNHDRPNDGENAPLAVTEGCGVSRLVVDGKILETPRPCPHSDKTSDGSRPEGTATRETTAKVAAKPRGFFGTFRQQHISMRGATSCVYCS